LQECHNLELARRFETIRQGHRPEAITLKFSYPFESVFIRAKAFDLPRFAVRDPPHIMQMETEMAPTEYVEERGGGYYLAGSRVSLASVILGFRDGASPETIRQNFPSLSLAQVYGAIAFYLSHPDESEQME
jgi:uncharacterized protein (DUF433 family)